MKVPAAGIEGSKSAVSPAAFSRGSVAEPSWASYGPTDIPYLRTYFKQLAPAWLDHVAILQGFAPPRRESAFAWCELGCGQGITPVVLAATHPHGRFFGIDAMPKHIRFARRLAREAGAANAVFHLADFASARRLELPKFDYIVAHGVYSWIDAPGQRALQRFIDDRLAPGGIVYLSYNAMPGWASDLALRQILFESGQRAHGDSLERISASIKAAQSLGAAGAIAFVGSRLHAFASLEKAYLAHEFLGSSWKPLYVTEVRAALAKIRLVPVGSARLIQNYDSFVLRKAARDVVDAIEDDDLRELTRDCFLNCSFRCDVFTRDCSRLTKAERVKGLRASTFMLARPAAAIRFEAKSPAGSLKFDNDVSRGIVARLAAGPLRLDDLRDGSISSGDLLANALTLVAADAIMPVEHSQISATKLVEAVYRRLDGPDEIRFLPLPHGTALPVALGLLQRLRDGRTLDDYAGWQDFLTAQGFLPAKHHGNGRPAPEQSGAP